MPGPLVYSVGAGFVFGGKLVVKVILYLVRRERNKSILERLEEIKRNEFQRQMQEISDRENSGPIVSAWVPNFQENLFETPPMWLRDP